MTCRAYTPDDFPTIQAWASARAKEIHPLFFGKRGFIVEDQQGPCAVLMVFLMCDVPIATVDNFYSRPGLGPSVEPAWDMLWDHACAYLRELKDQDGNRLVYPLVRTFCKPKLVKQAKRKGWHVAEGTTRCIEIVVEL